MYKVLLVDDETNITEGMQMLIPWEEHGFTIKGTAEDGVQALEKLGEGGYQLVITDIRMPEMDGLRLSKEIIEIDPAIKLVVLSGYNEFQYAKQAMQLGVKWFMVKPVEVSELKTCLQTVKQELDAYWQQRIEMKQTNDLARDKFMLDLVHGWATEQELRHSANKFAISICEQDAVRSVLIEISHFHSLLLDNLYETKLIKYGLRNMTEEIIMQPGLGFVYEEQDGLLGVIFRNTDAEEVNEALKRVDETMRSIFRLNLMIGVGRPALWRQLKGSRKQAQFALDAVPTKAASIHYFRTSPEESAALELEWDSTAFIMALEEGDLHKRDREVHDLIDELKLKELGKSAVKWLLFGILLRIKSLMKKHGLETDSWLVADDLDSLSTQPSDLDKARNWLQHVSSNAARRIMEQAETKEPHIIEEVIAYIDEQYKEDISLKTLAGRFYMNTAYLGQLFKLKVGESFNDYLNKLRIAQVKRMIMQRNAKMLETLQAAGFNSAEHFYRQFKRYEGISFSEYRQSQRIMLDEA
jgi:two-component system response regulator YesN